MPSCVPHKLEIAEGNFAYVPSIGIGREEMNANLYIKDVVPDYPGAAAGLKPGDIITSINGNAINTEKDYMLALRYANSQEVIVVEIRRGGNLIKYSITPKQKRRLSSALKIDELLLNDKRVSIAIIVSDVKNSYPNVPQDWVSAQRNNTLSDMEAGMIQSFGSFKSFSIVDRSRLQNILGEHQLAQMGFVSDEIRNKIGEFTGATHIYDITYQRFIGAYNQPQDLQTGRLIDVQTGNVIAVDNVQFK